MWISQLELVNFKSYQHQIFDFPQPRNGKNLILIGGLNGYGKTTLLEALYLGLFGQDAIIHLVRAGLKSASGYHKFLEGALHGHDGTRDTMSVTVQINKSQSSGLSIQRKWYFNKNGIFIDQDINIYSVKNGVKQATIPDHKLSEILEQYFVPAHIAPFFFFDGEEVKSLAAQDRVEQIRQGMEGLLVVSSY